jgi:hypothetical protein
MEAATQTKDTENVTNLPVKRNEILVVNDPIAVLDTARFDHMMRIARAMAASTLIPTGLCTEKNQMLPVAQIAANCFLVVNQAVRWGMDPFAVAQCVSVIHGKLCYEGKLIAAVLNAKLGYDLEYEISGADDAMKIVVTAAKDGKVIVDSHGQPRKIEGVVAEWRTRGDGSPWEAPGGKPRMLRYRGAREWARVYSPALMLGVYSDDELADMSEDARANRAKDITPSRIIRGVDPDAPVPRPAPQPVEQPKTEEPPQPQQSSAPQGPDPDAPVEKPLFDTLVEEIKNIAADEVVTWGIKNSERLVTLTAQQRLAILDELNKRGKALNRA